MSEIIGENANENLNQVILEREEEERVLVAQKSSIDFYNEVERRGSSDFGSARRGSGSVRRGSGLLGRRGSRSSGESSSSIENSESLSSVALVEQK